MEYSNYCIYFLLIILNHLISNHVFNFNIIYPTELDAKIEYFIY